MHSETAPETDEACTTPVPGASRTSTSYPSQPRTAMQGATFGTFAQQAARPARGAVWEDRRGSRCLGTVGSLPSRATQDDVA